MEIASVDSARAKGSVSPWGVLVTWGATTPIAPYRFPAIMKWPRDRKSVFVVKGGGYVRVPVIDFTVH